MNTVVTFEKHPQAGSFYRSDHFNFAKAGVPALYIGAGTEVIGKPDRCGLQQEEEYTKLHYHRPSDEFTTDWKMDGALDDLKL